MPNTLHVLPAEPGVSFWAKLPLDGLPHGRRKWALGAGAAVMLVIIAAFVIGLFHRIGFGYFAHPPIYGFWDPMVSRFSLVAIGMALVLAALAWYLTSGSRLPTWLVLTLVIAAGVAASAAVNMIREYPLMVRGVTPGFSYATDVHLVYEMGVREITERYPDLTGVFKHHNTKTHPPGVLVLMFGLFRLFGASTLMSATVIAALGMCAAIAAWSMGRVLGGERAGLIAAILVVAAPGPLLLSFTSMDAIFVTVLSGAAALLMVAIHRSSAAWALAAGAAAGAATYLTYAISFVVIAGGIAVLMQAKAVREAVRLLGAAALGGLLALAATRLLFGFDLLASYSKVPPTSHPFDPYWIVGAPAAVFVFAGMPLAILGIVGFFRKSADRRALAFPIVLFAIMLIWFALPSSVTHLRAGEVERTWAYMYPILAACAAPIVSVWVGKVRRIHLSGLVVGCLVLLSVGQAIVIQSGWDTRF